jgi:probable phosphoglycerate mutase
MQLKMVIVRHAESEQQIKGITGGWSNTDITERGIAQAALTGTELQRMIDDDYLFLSCDLPRARKTLESLL